MLVLVLKTEEVGIAVGIMGDMLGSGGEVFCTNRKSKKKIMRKNTPFHNFIVVLDVKESLVFLPERLLRTKIMPLLDLPTTIPKQYLIIARPVR